MATKAKDKEDSGLTHAVFFTDGSARPTNPGAIGWSVHGYVFNMDETKKGQGHAKVAPTPTGYVMKDAKPTLLNVKSYYDFVGWAPGPLSNNAAEVYGIAQALKYAGTIPSLNNVTIYSDSKYAIKGATEMVQTWVANNWIKRDGSEVANQDAWKKILHGWDGVAKNQTKVKIEWVKGHADNFGNHQADMIAGIGSEKGASEADPGEMEIVSQSEGYWKNEETRHPMIGHRGVIISSDAEHQVPGEYFQLSQVKTDEFIARKAVDAGFGYCMVTEPDDLVEMVRKKQVANSREHNALYLLRVDRIYDKAVSSSLRMFGDIVLKKKSHLYNHLFFINESAMAQSGKKKKNSGEKEFIPISEELFPALLAFRAINHCSTLKGFAMAVKAAYEKDPTFGTTGQATLAMGENAAVHDITDVFFDNEKDKKGKDVKMFKKTIGISDQSIKVDKEVFGLKTTFQFIFAIHLLSRNSLKRFEETDVRVWLVATRMSDKCIRYLTVIKSNNDWSAWVAPDSSTILTKEEYKPII